MKPTITLTERKPRRLRLPRSEVDFLLAHARSYIDLTPRLERGTFRLTARGYVGFITGPHARYVIRPKIPWPNLRLLLGIAPETAGEPREPEGELLAVLATEFVERLNAVTRGGLVAGYSEADTVSGFLRGKLRTAAQMRDSAARAFPDQFHLTEPVFDLNTHWNQIPKATATALLRGSALPSALRRQVEVASLPLAIVADAPATETAFTAALSEPRAIGYRDLLAVCRVILNGLASAEPLARATDGEAFLLDLGNVFERYLATSLQTALTKRPLWRVEAHPDYALGPTTLTPDILLRKRGVARVVLDAKWKAAAVDANDLHQVLAYATMTGAPRVALVYPGRTDAGSHFATPDGRVRVSRYVLRVIGTAGELSQSIAKLARDVRRK